MALIGAAAIAVKASSAGLAQDLGRCTRLVDDSAKGWEKRVTQIKPARMTMIADAAEMGASARKTMLMPDAAQKQEFANAAKDADILTTAIKRQEQELQRQIATFKMSADQIEIWELEQRGATKAQIDSVRALQVQRKALQDAAGAGDLATKRIQRLPELGEKIHAGFGRISMAASTFQTMASDADGFTKSLATVDAGISSMTVGLQLAVRATNGLKAALIGTGIGAAIMAIGYLVSKIASARDDAAAAAESMDAAMKRRLALLSDRPEGRDRGSTVTELEGGGASVERRAGRAGGPMGATPRTTTTVFSAASVAAVRASESVDDLARSMRDVASAAGRSSEHMALVRHEAELTAAVTDMMFATSDEERRGAAAAVDRLRASLSAAHTARVGSEGTRSVGAMEMDTARLREVAATSGMSAEAAAEYRDRLVETTRRIGDMTVATRESLTPMESHARRLIELADIEARTGADMAGARTASLERAAAEEIALTERRAARLAAASAEERRRVEEPFAASRREMDRIGDLFVRGGTDAATFGRGIEMTLGVARRPARALADELRRIQEVEDSAREAARREGGIAGAIAFNSAPFEEARRSAREALVPPDTTETFARRMRDIGEAFRAGSISAVDFGRASTEALRGVIGDTRGPFEQLTERFRIIDSAIADSIGEGALTAGAGREMQRMARARAVLSATASVRLDMPAGVQALERGSVEAVRAINEARRSGPSDPVARTLAAMERQREITEAEARDTRRIADAIEGGLFAPFIG